MSVTAPLAPPDPVRELVDRLAAGVEQLCASNDWLRFLDVARRFHRYSFWNTIAILTQRPDATRIGGYRRWQQLGRQVRRGEHGIRILAPCAYRRTIVDEDTGDEQQRTATIEALEAAGVTIVDRAEINQHPKATSLRDLTDNDNGSPLTEQTHANCAGHVATIDTWSPTESDYYCLDPDKYRLHNRWRRSGRPATPMTDEQKAERREVIEGNWHWRAAQPVRLAYIKDLVARRSPRPCTLRYLARVLITDPEGWGRGTDHDLADLVDAPQPTTWGRPTATKLVDDATDKQLPTVLLAQHAVDIESTLGDRTWRQSSPRAAGWFAFLASTGYTLAEIEQRVIDRSTQDDDLEAVGDTDSTTSRRRSWHPTVTKIRASTAATRRRLVPQLTDKGLPAYAGGP
jgi:N-terminal domain of anti-restriction factor ArdC